MPGRSPTRPPRALTLASMALAVTATVIATGGIWKTTNDGTTFPPVFDSYGTHSAGALAISPANLDIVRVGTREANNRHSSPFGEGIYESTDRGESWNHVLGVDENAGATGLVTTPADPDVVHLQIDAAADRKRPYTEEERAGSASTRTPARPAWSPPPPTPTSSTCRSTLPPTASADTLCVETVDRHIHKLEKHLEVPMDGGILSSLEVTREGVIVVGSGSGAVYFINQDGTHKTFMTGGPVGSFIALLDDNGHEVIGVGSWDTNLYLLKSDGTELTSPIYTSGKVIAAPALTKKAMLLIGSEGGGFHFIKPDRSVASFKTDIGFSSSPLLVEDGGKELIVVGGNDGVIYYFDADRNPVEEPIASFATGGLIYSSPALSEDGESIVVGSNDGKVYSLDLQARQRWVFETDGASSAEVTWEGTQEDGDGVLFGRNVASSPAVVPGEGTIVVGGGDGKVYFLNSDGSEKASYQTQGPVISSPHVMEDGTVVVGSMDGYIYFFYPDGHLKASYKTEYIDDTGRKRIGTMMASPTSYKKNGQEYAVMGTGGGVDRVYSFRVTDEVEEMVRRCVRWAG